MSNESKLVLKSYIKSLIKEHIIIESKQSIINLGFPEVISSLLYEQFGDNAFTIASWLKDYTSYQFSRGQSGERQTPKDWWRIVNNNSFLSRDRLDLTKLVYLYDAAKISKEEYNRVSQELGLSGYQDDDYYDQQESIQNIKELIKEKLFEDIFFRSTLITDIMSGEIKDLKPYKKLSFDAAKKKYDKKRLFKSGEPLKIYSNGWKWIDAGPKCELVGGLMKNCGSTGVMSTDPDRTMLTLFDKGNKPHVVATYSPNEKRISGVEGQASTESKEKYDDYVLDIAEFLGAKYDIEKSKSSSISLKTILKSVPGATFQFLKKTSYNTYYLVTLDNGEKYYTESKNFISEKDIKDIAEKEDIKNINDSLESIFGKHRSFYGPYKDYFISYQNFIERYGL